MFSEGIIRVLCCTATLAWGVNLPAHGVIIKGTELYDAGRGGWVDVDILDVIQIFGRAGRPQFDTTGEGCLIGMHDSIDNFARLMVLKVGIHLEYGIEIYSWNHMISLLSMIIHNYFIIPFPFSHYCYSYSSSYTFLYVDSN